MIASNASIKAALEPVKFFQGTCEGSCDFGSRFAVQPVGLEQPGTRRRISQGASKVPSGLGVVMGLF